MEKENRTQTLKKILYFSLVFLLIVFVVSVLGSSNSSTSEPSLPTDRQAHIVAQSLVKSTLKAPSTAEFPLTDGFIVNKPDKNTYVIDSYVDSQNGFGAMIRTDWSATLEYTGGDWASNSSWKIKELIVDGQTMYSE